MKNIKDFLKKNYNIDNLDTLKILGNNENLVFLVKDKVFRLTNFSHRTEQELDTETKLLDILYKNGADVVKIIKSLNGNFFEKNENEKIYITAFELAKGEIIDINSFSNKNDIIIEWGRTMGKIHKITSNNFNKLNFSNRLDWYNEIIIKDADKLLPKNENYILEILKGLIDSFNGLDKNIEDYGLVHTDMRPRNFHYSNGKIIHFDFDDISNNWYIFDVAVAIFHETESFKTREERTEFMANFIKNFLKGYLKEKSIKNIYLEKLIDFMHIRLIYAYIDYYKRLKIKGIDSGKDKMLYRKKFIGEFDDFIDTNKIKKIVYSFKN